MSSPRGPPDTSLGLSASETRILAFSTICQTGDGGKNPIDWDKLGKKLNLTTGSTKVMYGNARRKLIRLHGDAETPLPSTTNEAGDNGQSPKKARKTASSSSHRKRKADKDDEDDDDSLEALSATAKA
ncbi:uncharacterized protein N7482_009291 [Penicillium canariense]|uniref:Uncharacterized protein n=1 Tax=Penicillium canariense TaxID=189055 RepID=A0A9W9LFP6_9EURO|nr:uncharacterized protein N7482_009291 [Penicillium canariense]KAJ5152813.1 hypothetical protein N7482_009291 [Penicillium canariense]